MSRVEDDALAVTRFETGERARIDPEALDNPGAGDDEDDDQQAGGEVLLHAPAVFELFELRLGRWCPRIRFRDAQGRRRLDGADQRALGSFRREGNDIHIATLTALGDLARAIFHAQGELMAALERLPRTWDCQPCRRYRWIALALIVAAGCALMLL